MSDKWPSGMTRVDLLTLSQKDREVIRNALNGTLVQTKRAHTDCVRRRGIAFKHNPSQEPQWEAQAEAYQRGITRLTRLMELFR